MSYYFKLQAKRLQRKSIEIGIPPVLGYLLLVVLFIALSSYLFYKLSYAPYIYVGFAILFLLQLGATNRTDLLQAIYQKKDYYQIRVIENTITALPFALYLIYDATYWLVIPLLLVAVSLAFLSVRQQGNFTIPTPFKKIPFELIVGFRKSFPLFLLAYFLAYKAIEVGNVNLNWAAIGLVFLTSLSFYAQPESTYFVWIYSKTVNEFLRTKITHAFLGVSLLSLPIWIAVGIAFPSSLAILAGIQLLGYLFLMTLILAKYSAFPKEINLPQALLFGLSFLFPPLFLVIIPIFYIQSKKRLVKYLKMNNR